LEEKIRGAGKKMSVLESMPSPSRTGLWTGKEKGPTYQDEEAVEEKKPARR